MVLLSKKAEYFSEMYILQYQPLCCCAKSRLREVMFKLHALQYKWHWLLERQGYIHPSFRVVSKKATLHFKEQKR
jgi:hypothetical protein